MVGSATLFSTTAEICAAQSPIEYGIPTLASGPAGIAAGPDGNLWFLEFNGNNIGKIATGGAITEYTIPTSPSGPVAIAAGPDGNLWFTEGIGKIGKMTTGGTVTEYLVPTSGSLPAGIAAGPDGNLWFTEYSASKIGKMTTGGTITEYLIPTSGSDPLGIAAGPDGNLWFAENTGNNIGKITTGGAITEYTIPTSASGPEVIAAGPDGNLWFTEKHGNNIGKISTGGTVTEYAVPTSASGPWSVTAGPDGNLWFTEAFGNKIGRITTGGTVTEYPVPTSASGPEGIAAGPDGNLWFTEYNASKIGKITTGTVTSTLSHAADGDGFDTLVLLINTGTVEASYALQFFNQSGAPVTYPLDPAQSGITGTISAGSQAIVRTTGSGASTNLGWGQLTALPLVKGMVIYQQQASPTSLQEGSAPITAPSQHFFVPFDNVGATTSIGFVNPSATQTANVNFTVRYEAGGTDTVPVFGMNPLQQLAQPVTFFWGNTAGKKGMIEVNVDAPIGLVAFRFQGTAFTLFDTIADTAGASTPITSTIAHAADGNNFRSTFILTNSGMVAAPYTLSILNATGQPQTFNFDVANPLAGTVPAGSTLTIDTTGLGSVTNLGWAQLSAAPAVGGIEVFRQTNPGKSEQQATIPISQTNSEHFFLPFDNAANTTSIALANPDPAITATISVTFRYVDGTSNTGQLTLPSRNYNANLLASLFSATAGKAGVAEFTSNVRIAVVEVRFNPTQAFTSLRAVSP